MRRVALINPPAPGPLLRDYFCTSVAKTGYLWHPIDLLTLSGFVAGRHEPVVVDAVAEGLDGDAALTRLGRGGLLATVFLAAAGRPEDLAFAARVKEAKGGLLVGLGEELLGGPGEALERHPHLDAVVTDFTADSLVRWFDGERGGLPGIVWRDGDHVRGDAAPARGTFSIPPPEHAQFPLDGYRLPFAVAHPWATVLASFGCPFGCAYCNSGTFGYKARDPGNLAEELDLVQALGIRHVFVRDMTFAADRAHGAAIVDVLEGRGLTWNCHCRIDRVDQALLGSMAASGCVMIHFGVESASADLRAALGRGTGVERAADAFRWAREAGIGAGAHFILGLPGEDEADVGRTIALARSLRPDYASFNVYTPRAGSALARRLRDEGRLAPGARDSSFGEYRVTGGIPPARLERLRRRAVLSFYADPRYLLRQAGRVRSLDGLLRLARAGLGVVAGP